MKNLTQFLLACLLISPLVPARAVQVSAEEQADARRWFVAKFEGTTEPPFSFVFNGKPSAELLKTWKVERSSHQIDAQRHEETLTWTDAASALQVRCVAVEYTDFPTVEWTLHFKNTGTSDTPILSDLFALDTHVEKSGGADFVLHHNKGTFVRADDFEPLRSTLKPNDKLRFAPPAGRPLGQVFPYFNLEQQADQGVIAVVGWPGQWFAE